MLIMGITAMDTAGMDTADMDTAAMVESIFPLAFDWAVPILAFSIVQSFKIAAMRLCQFSSNIHLVHTANPGPGAIGSGPFLTVEFATDG